MIRTTRGTEEKNAIGQGLLYLNSKVHPEGAFVIIKSSEVPGIENNYVRAVHRLER
jgi:hypothetical protein